MNTAAATPLAESELARLEARFAARSIALPGGEVVSVRECGAGNGGPVFVCLHGIGSGAASWLDTALLLQGKGARVIAWEAPGYGASTPVASISCSKRKRLAAASVRSPDGERLKTTPDPAPKAR